VRSEPLVINIVGIEVAADPFLELSVAFVRGIADDIEEFGIAPRAADIFRRTASAGIDQSRIDGARLWIEEPLDLDRVLPAIAKVVGAIMIQRSPTWCNFSMRARRVSTR
jgi:hypothetical protein